MPVELYANDVATTLVGAHTAGQATFTVASSVGFPAPAAGQQFRVRVGAEYVTVTAVSGTTWTVVRGAEGSAATSHADGATVTHVVTAGALADRVTLDARDTMVASLRAHVNVTGGGTITVTGFAVKWTTRFLVIANGKGSHFTTGGLVNIDMPAVDTVITGVGGATNKTVVANGIPLNPWDALYYILPIGGSGSATPANFRVASYTSDFVAPETWVQVAVRGESNTTRFINGVSLPSDGGTWVAGDQPVGRTSTIIGGTNIVRNASFEAGSGNTFTNWSGSSGNVTLTSVSSRNGVGRAIRYTSTGSGNNGTDRLNGSLIGLPGASTKVTISYWYRRISGTGTLAVAIDSWAQALAPSGTSSTWERVVWTGTTPAAATPLYGISFYLLGAANDVFEIDDVQVQTGDVPTGFAPADEILPGVVTDTMVATANKDGAAGTPSMRTLGTGATQAAAGNDSRLVTNPATLDTTQTITGAKTFSAAITANGGVNAASLQATEPIGGANLLATSRTLTVTPLHASNLYGTEAGTGPYRSDGVTYDAATLIWLQREAASTGGIYRIYSVNEGGWWTFSFWYKRRAGVDVAFSADVADVGAQTLTATDTWQKAVVTGNVTNFGSTYRFVDIDLTATDTGIHIFEPKLERGRVPTAYTPTLTELRNAAQINTGIFSTDRLGTGTASSQTFLRGDGTWSTQVIPTRAATALPSTYPVGLSTHDADVTWPRQFGTVVTSFLSTHRAWQTFIPKTEGELWFRSVDNDAWTAWKQVVTSDDTRLTDARTPTAHTHGVTDLTATGTRDATTFLRGDNTWATPGGGGAPVGSMLMYAGSAAPNGYLLCQGQSLDTTTYAALFAVTGYAYGGSGASFNLPDMRVRVPVGAGTSKTLGASDGVAEASRNANRTHSHNHGHTISGGTGYASISGSTGTSGSTAQSASVNTESTTTSVTGGGYVGHNHSSPTGGASAGTAHTHSIGSASGGQVTVAGSNHTHATSVNISHSHSVSASDGGHSHGTSGSVSTNTTPESPFTVVNYIIKTV